MFIIRSVFVFVFVWQRIRIGIEYNRPNFCRISVVGLFLMFLIRFGFYVLFHSVHIHTTRYSILHRYIGVAYNT